MSTKKKTTVGLKYIKSLAKQKKKIYKIIRNNKNKSNYITTQSHSCI